MKVVLDTNFILITLNYRLDPIELLLEHEEVNEIIIPSFVLEELKKVTENNQKLLEWLNQVLKRKIVRVEEVERKDMPVDKQLLKLCKEKRYGLATLDKILIKKARKMNIPVFTLANFRIIRL